MKKIAVVALVCIFLGLALSGTALAAKPGVETIQGGSLVDSKGNPLTVGYDQWGYNYQAHIFNGYYDNFTRPPVPVQSGEWWLVMKWNDAWLANTSADGDFRLDRHFGFTSYVGSGAWCTNHILGPDGYEYFCKVVAVPADAELRAELFTGADDYVYTEGVWYTSGGLFIGPSIWGQFAVTQEVSTGGGSFHGTPGLGNW